MEENPQPLPAALADVWCLNGPGSWIVLDGVVPDESSGLQAVLKALESTGSKALVAYREPVPNGFQFRVRMDVPDPTECALAAERYGFNVIRTIPPTQADREAQDALDNLHHYLNL